MRAQYLVTFLVGCCVAACDILDPGSGTVHVKVATTGGDVDVDGYVVSVAGGDPRVIGANGAILYHGVPDGLQTVALLGLAANCTVSGDNPRAVEVVRDETVLVPFAVDCVATGVQVSIESVGVDFDQDGYEVLVDGVPAADGVVGTASITRLSPGTYTVALRRAAPNCTIADPTSRTVTVALGEIAPVDFHVTCVAVAGILHFTTATTGIDLDGNGYAITLDGGPPIPIDLNTTATIKLAGGDYSLRLTDVAGNCTVAGDNPRAVRVTTGGLTRDTARTTFQVSCGAATGSIRVTTVTSGVDLDPNGYQLRVNDAPPRALGVNAVLSIDGLDGGSYRVTLDGVNSNCTVAAQNPRTVVVSTGGPTRDTARTTFEVGCVAVERIAFARTVWDWDYGDVQTIGVTYGDTSLWYFGRGDDPAWSPDGTQLAFANLECLSRCSRSGLARRQADGLGFQRLTSDSSDRAPAWRPDGARLAFTRGTALYLINADGSGGTPLPWAGWAANPAWSPDGTRIAFTCQVVSGNLDVCLINPDGTGLLRLTSDPAPDVRPAWKPDGSRIAFSTARYGLEELAVMAPDGSGVTRLSPGTPATQPAWSPDGGRIVFAGYQCGISTGCTAVGLSVINADGTGPTRITSGLDYAPAWRP